MRNRRLIGAFSLGIMTGTAITGATILLASPAKADPVTDSAFLTTLDDAGIGYTSRSAAITAGHAVCTMFDRGMSPLGVVKTVYENASGLTSYQAGYFVGASVGAYCDEYGDLVLSWAENTTSANTISAHVGGVVS